MTVLGILTCEIFELELAYLLKNDTAVQNIHVLDNLPGQGIINALRQNGVKHLYPLNSISSFQVSGHGGGMDVLVYVVELAMHSRKSLLQEAIVTAARIMETQVDALFLGYGLCGNAFDDPDTLLKQLDVPWFLPRDADHYVDDCVGLFIGGRESYYAQQLKEAGTFFMTPGWVNHWKVIFEKEFGGMSLDMAKRLFKHYKRTLLIPNPAMDAGQMQEQVQEFNRLFGCTPEIATGYMDILTKAWDTAKKHVLTHPVKTPYPWS
jgi:hypothetical protein